MVNGKLEVISCALCCIFSLDCGRIVIMSLLLEIHELAIHILTSHICVLNLLSQNCPKQCMGLGWDRKSSDICSRLNNISDWNKMAVFSFRVLNLLRSASVSIMLVKEKLWGGEYTFLLGFMWGNWVVKTFYFNVMECCNGYFYDLCLSLGTWVENVTGSEKG